MEKRLDFEKAFKELEQIVSDLEEGSLPLETAIEKFKTGSRLAKECSQRLKSVKVKVNEVVTGEKGRLKKKAFKQEE